MLVLIERFNVKPSFAKVLHCCNASDACVGDKLTNAPDTYAERSLTQPDNRHFGALGLVSWGIHHLNEDAGLRQYEPFLAGACPSTL